MSLWMGLLVVWRPAQAQELEPLAYETVTSFSTLFGREGRDPLRWEVNGPDGIAWDGSGIWVTGCDSMVFGKLDVTGGLIEQFRLPGMEMADHLAWDGEYLWGVVHSMPGQPGPPDGRIIKTDTAAAEVVHTIEVPFRNANTMSPMGLAWDGTYLWSMDPDNQDIYRIDPVTGEGKDRPIYKTPIINGQRVAPCGISWDGHSCLWMSVLSHGVYLQIDPRTGEAVSYISPPDNPDPTRFGAFRPPGVTKLFTGMTTDGDRVWVVDEIEGNPLIYELDVEFPTTGTCAHPVEIGQACVMGGQPYCDNNAICFTQGAASTCHARCTRAAGDCPEGSTCWTQPEVGDVCIPGANSGGFATACVDAAECQSALCVVPVATGVGLCSETCDPLAADACPAGFVCDESNGANVCQPHPPEPDAAPVEIPDAGNNDAQVPSTADVGNSGHSDVLADNPGSSSDQGGSSGGCSLSLTSSGRGGIFAVFALLLVASVSRRRARRCAGPN